MKRTKTLHLAVLAAGSLFLGGCTDPLQEGQEAQDGAEEAGDPVSTDPPTARRETLEGLRADLAAERHSSDGGGRAWLDQPDSATAEVRTGSLGSWTVLYEAGPEGIDVGGAVRFLVSPFWDWSPAQARLPGAPGYTTVESLAEGVELDVSDRGWVHAEIQGRRLEEGERLSITYGAGQAQARADQYAERGSRFWVAVDGDGDGVQGLLDDSPTVDIVAGSPARLSLVLQSTAAPGEEVTLHASVLDGRGNAGYPFEGTLELVAVPNGLDLPKSVTFESAEGGAKTIRMRVGEPGVYRLAGEVSWLDEEGETLTLRGEANPLLVEEGTPRILWGDLHGHSQLSDGTGTPEDYFRYARDVAGLDVSALTDHDHWGMRALSMNPEMWQEIRDVTREFHAPGEFVTLLGYEWTNWLHGHRHVIYFGDEGEVFSSVDPAYETPAQLWDALRGKDALTFAHHSAGGPIATNWDFPPDPELEPITEVASVHGSSEALDAPLRIYDPLPGNFVRDVLDRGHRLGFIGSGDTHDGHPGLARLSSGNSGGLAAILSEEKTRDGVRAALRGRRAYATNGSRTILRCALDGARMGSVIPPKETGADAEPSLLYVRAIACAPIRSVDVIRSGEVVAQVPGEDLWDLATAVELEELAAGEYVYVRVVEAGGGTAWSSPFYVE